MDIINKLYESVDYNNLKFEYVGPTKDVSFYEFMDSKEVFGKIKNNQIGFIDALEKPKLFLNKLNDVKTGKKTPEQKEMITNFKSFTSLEKKFLIFLNIILKCTLMLATKQNKMKPKEQDRKY